MIAWLIRYWSSGCQLLLKRLTGTDQVDTPWTVAYQDSLSKGILQARILEWRAGDADTRLGELSSALQ